MLQTGLQPGQGTLTNMISTCSTLVVHVSGRALQTSVTKIGYESDAMVTSSLILMFSR